MQILPILNNSSERLQDNITDLPVNIDFNEIKNRHAAEYRYEIQAVTSMSEAIGEDKKSEAVEQWGGVKWARIRSLARETNMIGKVTGVNTDLSFEETTRAYTEKTKLKDITEFGFGDLREFNVRENEEFLNSVVESDEHSSNTDETESEVNNGLLEAQARVAGLALDNPINDNRFEAEDSQFALA